MDEGWYGPIELAFAFGLPLAWCFRELWLLRKHRLKREAARKRDQEPSDGVAS
jgi:hypothetical protein